MSELNWARHRQLAELALKRAQNQEFASQVDSIVAVIDQAAHEAVQADRERSANIVKAYLMHPGQRECSWHEAHDAMTAILDGEDRAMDV